MYIEPLVESLNNCTLEIQRMHQQMQMLERTLHRFDELAASYMAEEGSYSYIPLDLGDFTSSMLDLHTALGADEDYMDPALGYRPVSYLEVGCGIGRNLFIVMHGSGLNLGRVRGIEISLPYVIQARQFFSLHEEVSVGDAMKYDYSDFDVIYFYRPFSDEALESKFERKLIREAKPGAYLVGHLNSLFENTKCLKAVREGSRVYKKHKPVRKTAKKKAK